MAIRDFNNPMGLLQQAGLGINNNPTGSLGLNISPIFDARTKQAEEEAKRKRAEQSLKLQNFADTLRMVNANKSGNTQGVALYSNRLANRRAEEQARLDEAKRKAGIEAYLNTPEGSKYRQAYELKDKLGINLPTATDRKYEKAGDGFYRYIDGDQEKVFGGIEIVDPKFIQTTEDNPMGLSEDQIFNRTDKLSDDYRAGSKDFITIRDSMGKVLESAINPSPFGDLAIIFSAMKVLDPGSVVRESEFKTVEQAAPYLTRLGFDKNKIESFKEGKLLTPDQRADVVGTVLNFYNSSNRSQQGIMDYYANRAVQSGLKSENVIYDFGDSVTPKIELFNYVNNLYQLDNNALILESQKQTDDEKKKLILKEFERRDK